MTDTAMNILLIDDDRNVGEPVSKYLSALGYAVKYCDNPRVGIELVKGGDYPIVVTDLNMPDLNGIEVIQQVKELSYETEVIVITGYGTMENAVEALRAGAADFLHKPVVFDDLHLAIQKVARYHALWEENLNFREQIDRDKQKADDELGSDTFIGSSPQVIAVRELIAKAAQVSDATVLITGESGTGKELTARLIHQNSDRMNGPYISVNCSGFTPALIESELFGHEKGAFTGADSLKKGVFELADGGTLFLDEIGDMPTNLQSRLLRVLEERSFRRVGGQKNIDVDIRLISATNQNLPALVEEKVFRKDLFFRLNMFEIGLPPLGGRHDDIKELVEHYVRDAARHQRKPEPDVSDKALEALLQYHFPGNVRELKNIIERALMLSDEPQLELKHFRLDDTGGISSSGSGGLTTLNLETLENQAVQAAMDQADGNQTKAAELLGISRYALLRKLKKQ